jgi:predicted RNase H-like HicB family nuclease
MVIFKEGETFVSYCPELDVSSCGGDTDEARKNLRTAVRLFLEEAERMGTLADILSEAGYNQDHDGKWNPPRMVAVESVELS